MLHCVQHDRKVSLKSLESMVRQPFVATVWFLHLLCSFLEAQAKAYGYRGW